MKKRHLLPVGRCGPQRRIFEEGFTAKPQRSPRNAEEDRGLFIVDRRRYCFFKGAWASRPHLRLRGSMASPSADRFCVLVDSNVYIGLLRRRVDPV
jgi:hypothetical protein